MKLKGKLIVAGAVVYTAACGTAVFLLTPGGSAFAENIYDGVSHALRSAAVEMITDALTQGLEQDPEDLIDIGEIRDQALETETGTGEAADAEDAAAVATGDGADAAADPGADGGDGATDMADDREPVAVYEVKMSGGVLCVFRDGEVVIRTSIPAILLRESDRELLEAGITVTTYEDILKLIEDLGY